jgi:type VI protein secretion system component Hcp
VRSQFEQLEGRELKTTVMDLGLSVDVDPPALTAAYIKFDGVDGESADKGHDKWIDIQSFTTEPQTARAAYIKFDGVDGESADKDHGKWIDIQSFRPGTR